MFEACSVTLVDAQPATIARATKEIARRRDMKLFMERMPLLFSDDSAQGGVVPAPDFRSLRRPEGPPVAGCNLAGCLIGLTGLSVAVSANPIRGLAASDSSANRSARKRCCCSSLASSDLASNGCTSKSSSSRVYPLVIRAASQSTEENGGCNSPSIYIHCAFLPQKLTQQTCRHTPVQCRNAGIVQLSLQILLGHGDHFATK